MEAITVEQIRKQIYLGDFTNDDINMIVQACQYARAQLARQNINTIRAGHHVQFRNAKTGRNITGEVLKVGRKFLTVREHGMSWGNWRVPANMVEVI